MKHIRSRFLFNNRTKTIVFIVILWSLATAFNITKAVHIDDTAYIEEAREIIKNPLHPMTGMVNFFDTLEPIRLRFHPLLIPYLYAGVMVLFGESLLALHALMSFFSLLSILFFYKLSRLFVPVHPEIVTALFVLSPAFIPSQNLMLDIPQLATWLIFFYFLFDSADKKKTTRGYAISSVLIGVSSLIKYAGFILFPIMVLILALRRHFTLLWTVVFGVAILIGWSLFNLFDYGAIHILQAQNTVITSYVVGRRTLFYVITLGALVPFSFLFLDLKGERKKSIILLLLGTAISVYASIRYWKYDWESPIYFYLRLYFFANGLFVLGTAVNYSLEYFWSMKKKLLVEDSIRLLILSVWFWGSSIYLIIFVPFMAVRHMIVVLPALFLILFSLKGRLISRQLYLIGMTVTIILASLLGISDWQTAKIYQTSIPAIQSKIQTLGYSGRTVWVGGHWGIQYYGKRAGFQQYDVWKTNFQNGDLVVMADNERQNIPYWYQNIFRKADNVVVPTTPLVWMKTLTDWPFSPSGYYAFTEYHTLPWAVSTVPLEEFVIYRIEK